MTTHLSDERVEALLRGALDDDARREVKDHLRTCTACAATLAREAAVDQVMWEARQVARERPTAARVAAPVATRARRRPRAALGWLAAAAGVVAMGALGYAGAAGSASTTHEGTSLLAWQNVVFYIPLVVGLLLVLGAMVGGHGHDGAAHHDVGHGHDHDHGGHDHGLAAKALSFLGVGRVPLTVVLMIAALVFGGLGLVLNAALAASGAPAWMFGPMSIAGALVGTAALTGSAARLIDRILPSSETYSISRHDFAGCTGKLLLPADPSSGYAQVKDREGNVHNIRCRTVEGELPKGCEILVVEYDEDTKIYVVDANPVAAASDP